MQQTALKIVRTLQQAGHIGYYAGGAVRDILLGKEPKDIDIATSAVPEEIENLFKKTFSIGKHFGVILVEEDEHHFEIATFRSDAGYSDGRRPDAVFFTNAEEDALRRDFTINGMFYDPIARKVYDYVSGQKDLKDKILRFIGDPYERILEDHLRILRAVRFKNRFELIFGPKAVEALQQHCSLIVDVSAERVREELTKMLVDSTRKKAFQDLFDLSILRHIVPKLAALKEIPQPRNYHSEGDVWTHTLLVIDELSKNPNPELAWAALLHDIGKAETLTYEEERIRFPKHEEVGEKISRKILRQLKFSKYAEGKICWLVRHHQAFDQFENMRWVTKLHYYDSPFFEDLLHLHKADLFGCIPLIPDFHKGGERFLKEVTAEYQRAHFDNLLPSAQEEFFTGEEIMNMLNIPAGKKVGEVKDALREAQLEGEVKNKKEAKKWILEKFL